jgi:hypothetical protein
MKPIEMKLEDFVPVSDISQVEIGDWVYHSRMNPGAAYRISAKHVGYYDLNTDMYYNFSANQTGNWPWAPAEGTALANWSTYASGWMIYREQPPMVDYTPDQNGDTEEDI